jgi:LPXTG-motif cell wall-anchored protein
MIFGAIPIVPMLKPAIEAAQAEVERKAAAAVIYDPKATDTQKQAALATVQRLTPAPPPPPGRLNTTVDFLTEHKTTLLVTAGLALAAGVGYRIWKRRRR